jgi:hypothetical protein
MSVTILPTFKGYTVDLQEQKFRRATSGKRPENIHFLSKKGSNIFEELMSFADEVLHFYEYK